MHIDSFIVDASIFAASFTRDVAISVALTKTVPPASLAGCPGERLVFVAARSSTGSTRMLSSLSVCATSYEGHMVDALASRAEEGRRSLR
jgi:hypothetical protein